MPRGAVSVMKPQGTEETGTDRPAAPDSPPVLPTAQAVMLLTRLQQFIAQRKWHAAYGALRELEGLSPQ